MAKEKKAFPAKTRPSQYFKIELLMKTECDERVNENLVKKWVIEQFNGADVGAIIHTDVTELAAR